MLFRSGDFNGKEFKPETEKIKYHYGNAFYASQTFNNMPDDRRVQIAWGKVPTEGMPFNQMMLFPVELKLHSTEDGIRMQPWPIDEIKSLYGKEHTIAGKTVKPGMNPLSNFAGDCFDIMIYIRPGADNFGFNIHGNILKYDVNSNELVMGETKALVKPVEDIIGFWY